MALLAAFYAGISKVKIKDLSSGGYTLLTQYIQICAATLWGRGGTNHWKGSSIHNIKTEGKLVESMTFFHT
jgi:hypothetical protein